MLNMRVRQGLDERTDRRRNMLRCACEISQERRVNWLAAINEVGDPFERCEGIAPIARDHCLRRELHVFRADVFACEKLTFIASRIKT